MKNYIIQLILKLMRIFQVYPGEITRAWERLQWKKWVQDVNFAYPLLYSNGKASKRFIKNSKPIGMVLDHFVVLLYCPCKQMTMSEAQVYCSSIQVNNLNWRMATADEIKRIRTAWRDIARTQYMLGIKQWFLPFTVETADYALEEIWRQYENRAEKKPIIPVANWDETMSPENKTGM